MSGYLHFPLLGVAEVASEDTYFLAEGPCWDPVKEHVLWVDIMEGAVHRGELRCDGKIDLVDTFHVPGTAGAVALADDGGLLIAGTQHLWRRNAWGELREGARLIGGVGRRLNDGKVDPAGRFFVGTKGHTREEELLVVEDGQAPRVIDNDLTLSNGLGWSRDGLSLYSIDTLTRSIFIRPYEPATGHVGERRLLTCLDHGYPDGMTVDAEDNLWVAVWGAGCVLKLSPDGTPLGRVEVPVPHVTGPAFIGPELDTLVITTAMEGMTQGQLDTSPDAGRLFSIKPGVKGRAPRFYHVTHTSMSIQKGTR